MYGFVHVFAAYVHAKQHFLTDHIIHHLFQQAYLARKWVPCLFRKIEKGCRIQAGVLVWGNLWGAKNHDDVNCSLHQASPCPWISFRFNWKVLERWCGILVFNYPTTQWVKWPNWCLCGTVVASEGFSYRYQRGQRDRLRWEGNKTCPPQPAPVATPEKDIKKLLLPHLVALENYPSVFASFY